MRRWKESASSVHGRRDCDDYHLALTPSAYLVIYGEQSGREGAVMQITNYSMKGKVGLESTLRTESSTQMPTISTPGASLSKFAPWHSMG